MILSKNKWKLQFESEYRDPEILDVLHKIKGISDYTTYYNLGFKDMGDPFLFKSMDKVVKKIKMSIRNNEKILVFGDYDVDGITATSILYRLIKEKGGNVYYMVPNRFSTGYGLSLEAAETIISEGYNLVITVDNGITSVDEVDFLIKNNISIIITDHHEPKDTLPKADYILHSYIDHDYPFEHLCGAGVAYKIAEAIDKDFARDYVELAMLGTIADMMPLIGENKAIINEGLKKLPSTKIKGLSALLKTIAYDVRSPKDISYNVAPKLNSLGRIGDASVAIKILIEDDEEEIREDIKKLYEADNLRKELTIQNTELAYKLVDPNDSINIIYSSSFYEGVLGIIAQKVMKKTNKITGVFNVDSNNNARGSFRTFGEYNLLEMLEANSDLLEMFGGHEKACGVTMLASNLKELKERFSKMVSTGPTETYLSVSCKLNHSLINTTFYDAIHKYDLQDTMFLFQNMLVIQPSLMADKHTKLKVKLNNDKYLNVIFFNDASLFYNISPGDRINVVGELNINNYNGYETLQVIAADYEVPGIQVIDYRKNKGFEQAKNFFDLNNGIILNGNFDSLSELSLIIKEQSPNIVYVGPTEEDDTAYKIANGRLVKNALYLITSNVSVKEIMLANQLKVSRQTLNIILDILEELDLINIEDGKITEKSSVKSQQVDFMQSETFEFYSNRLAVLDLLYGDINKIKEYVLESLE